MDLSIVIPVSERLDDVEKLFHDYHSAIKNRYPNHEFIYVFDGVFSDARSALLRLQEQGYPIVIIQLSKHFGEAIALTAGFDAATAGRILTLPSYFQIEAEEVYRLVDELHCTDMAIGVRTAKGQSVFGKLQRRAFNRIVSRLTGTRFSDLGCGARAIRKEVSEEVRIYGDQHRFLPLLASRSGFRVKEVFVNPSPLDSRKSFHRPGVYIRRLLDVLTIFFLVKFTKKPLRFFGLIGSATATGGAVVVAYVVIERLLGYAALADRPALLLGALFIVLGIQLFAVGLIGELLIFMNSGNDKEYRIESVVNINYEDSRTQHGAAKER